MSSRNTRESTGPVADEVVCAMFDILYSPAVSGSVVPVACNQITRVTCCWPRTGLCHLPNAGMKQDSARLGRYLKSHPRFTAGDDPKNRSLLVLQQTTGIRWAGSEQFPADKTGCAMLLPTSFPMLRPIISVRPRCSTFESVAHCRSFRL